MLLTAPSSVEIGSRRIRRLFTFSSWCFVAIGTSHFAVMASSLAGTREPAVRKAFDAMHAAPVTLFGITRDMGTLYNGFSATMALLAIGFGLVNLIVVRVAPEALTRGTSLLWTVTAVTTAALAIAIMAFPAPPIGALAAALTGCLLALGTSRRIRAGEPR
ncbi:MAG TPA: hypothetical protein VIV12_03115 [Streptosporangiaceae bacterium]